MVFKTKERLDRLEKEINAIHLDQQNLVAKFNYMKNMNLAMLTTMKGSIDMVVKELK